MMKATHFLSARQVGRQLTPQYPFCTDDVSLSSKTVDRLGNFNYLAPNVCINRPSTPIPTNEVVKLSVQKTSTSLGQVIAPRAINLNQPKRIARSTM
ncbi:hypothetical protein AKO1_001204 [Acrasis kona]|uniref:Uncharacterized protein n=1 Tax=Acrasis kona TaxID=1008807 RepID=A0AAW2ZCD9_9EUKA